MRLPSLRLPDRIGWRDHAVGAAMGAAYVAWLLATVRSVGVPRDEGVYFRAATDYVGWWRMLLERGHDALQQSAIDAGWSVNHEHPVLMKTLFLSLIHIFGKPKTNGRRPKQNITFTTRGMTKSVRRSSRPSARRRAHIASGVPPR